MPNDTAKQDDDKRRSLLTTITSDIHFWIPLLVLLAGLLLLQKLH